MAILLERENWETFQERTKIFTQEERWLLDSAYQHAKKAHLGQKRDGGERYFEHVRSVALIILDEFDLKEPDLIMAALLHDSCEDTPIFGNPTKQTYSQWRAEASFLLTKQFSPKVAEMVIALTRPMVDKIEVKNKQQAEELALENLIQASAEAKVLKMSDRLHNLRSLDGIKDAKRVQKKITETREHYFPIFKMAEGTYPEIVAYAINQMELAVSRAK